MRKIRSLLLNLFIDEMVISFVFSIEIFDDEWRKRLKKKMLELRKVDVVNLGLF